MSATSETDVQRIKDVISYDPNTGLLTWIEGGSSNRLAGKSAGCLRRDGYIVVRVDGRLMHAHRVAFIIMTGQDPGRNVVIDHVNGNKSDNTWANLRACQQRQNCANAKAQSRPKSSRYKGVTWFTARGKWMTKVCANYRSHTVGYFDNEHDAARAYNRKAVELFGDFARLNEVSDVR